MVLLSVRAAPVFAQDGDSAKRSSGAPAVRPDAGSRELSKKIVAARVNGVDITMDQVLALMDRLNTVRGQGGPSSGNSAEETKKEALDRLVLNELAYQKAAAMGIRATPQDIDKGMMNIKANLGGDEGYMKFLEKERLDEKEIRVSVERKVVIDKIFAQEVRGKAPPVQEQVIKDEYEKEKSRFVQSEKISLVDVVIFLKPGDKGSAQITDALLKKIYDNNNDPLRLVPDGTFIVRSYEPGKERDPELCEAARKLKEGELSGVVTTADSMHIIKLKDYVPEKQYTFEEVKGIIEGKFRAAAQKKRLKEWENELRKDAKIEIMAESGVTER